jgi:hypothetical protein
VPTSESNDSTTPTILSLPHPRTRIPTRYFAHPTKGLHEFTKIPSSTSQPRSWLITNERPDTDDSTAWVGNGQVLQDGALYIATPIDPLFLVLPHLLPDSVEEKKGHFVPLDDMLDTFTELEDKSAHWVTVLRPGVASRKHVEARVLAVSESVDVGDEKVYRICKEKLAKVLVKKCEAMATEGLPKSFEEELVAKPLVHPLAESTVTNPEPEKTEKAEGMWSRSSQLLTTSLQLPGNEPMKDAQSEQMQQPTQLLAPQPSDLQDVSTKGISSPPPEILHLLRLRVACQFLAASYLPPHISMLLTSHMESLNDFTSLDTYLAELKRLRAETSAARSGDFSLKRGLSDEAMDDREEKKRKKEEEEKTKKKGVSRAVQQLTKVNTRGMAKMTSFFKKKE